VLPPFHLALALHILHQAYRTHGAYVACDPSVSSDVVHRVTLSVHSVDGTRVIMKMGHCNDNKEPENNKLLEIIHVPVPVFTP
jgi:hypothetical protein